MKTDLASNLRKFVESVPAVSAEEARRRAVPIATANRSYHRKWWLTAWVRMAGAGLATGAIVVLVLQPWASGPSKPMALSATDLQLVESSSAAALDSGTAHLVLSSGVDGVNLTTASIDMVFSGPDVAETVNWPLQPATTSPEGAASPLPSSYVLANGILYRQIQDHWYAESASLAPNVLAAPTPRSLLRELSASDHFVSLGTEAPQGWTHLRAQDLSQVGSQLYGQIPGLGGGTITSFDVWVDSQNIVQRMRWTSTAASQACAIEGPNSGSDAVSAGGGTPSTEPGRHCTPSTVTESADVTFADLGTPQSITPPSGALPGSGPNDFPAG